jgi:hypothetical protein
MQHGLSSRILPTKRCVENFSHFRSTAKREMIVSERLAGFLFG